MSVANSDQGWVVLARSVTHRSLSGMTAEVQARSVLCSTPTHVNYLVPEVAGVQCTLYVYLYMYM